MPFAASTKIPNNLRSAAKGPLCCSLRRVSVFFWPIVKWMIFHSRRKQPWLPSDHRSRPARTCRRHQTAPESFQERRWSTDAGEATPTSSRRRGAVATDVETSSQERSSPRRRSFVGWGCSGKRRFLFRPSSKQPASRSRRQPGDRPSSDVTDQELQSVGCQRQPKVSSSTCRKRWWSFRAAVVAHEAGFDSPPAAGLFLLLPSLLTLVIIGRVSLIRFLMEVHLCYEEVKTKEIQAIWGITSLKYKDDWNFFATRFLLELLPVPFPNWIVYELSQLWKQKLKTKNAWRGVLLMKALDFSHLLNLNLWYIRFYKICPCASLLIIQLRIHLSQVCRGTIKE